MFTSWRSVVAVCILGMVALVAGSATDGVGGVFWVSSAGAQESNVWPPVFGDGVLLSSPRPDADARFGISTAASADGRTVVVGADSRLTPSSEGAAYVFTRPRRGWDAAAPPTGVGISGTDKEPGDTFGNSVSVSGDGRTIVVGAVRDSYGTEFNERIVGSAYVFTRSGGGGRSRRNLLWLPRSGRLSSGIRYR